MDRKVLQKSIQKSEKCYLQFAIFKFYKLFIRYFGLLRDCIKTEIKVCNDYGY